MTRAWWVLVLLLIISPLVSAGQTNPAKTAKLGQQVKQQPNTRGTKQQQQLKQQQQRTLGATVKQQQVNVKVAAAKKPGDEKIQLGAKITAGIKQGEKLEHKIHNLQQQLEDAQKKQAKLKEDQLRREKLKAEAEAKAKAEAPRVLIMQPVQTKAQLEKPTKSLRCGKVGNYYCINETTCCAKATGEWACCPKPSAICCQDKTHCCPQATTCDLKRGQCRGIGQTSPLMKKIGAVRLPKGSMVCPDHRSSCPEFYTCCPAQFGGFNCCPTPQAMCCPDKHHCCPHGSRCDPRHGRCDRGNQVAVPWFTKVPARPVAFGQIMCPGGQFECPTGSSCCRLKSGDWGCCPLPQAVCCEDGEHCCPRGYTCNQKMGSCQAQDEDALFVQWINVTDKHGMPPTPPNTICPSGKYKCPSDHTCCPRKGDLYGCCPFVEGTCCSDEKHCCPKGYECDLLKSKCVKGKGKVLLLSTLRASLDIRVPTSYQQLENFLNTGYLPAPDTSKSPVFDNLAKLKKMQAGKASEGGVPTPKVQPAQKQAQQQIPKAQVQQQAKQQKPLLKQQQNVKQQVKQQQLQTRQQQQLQQARQQQNVKQRQTKQVPQAHLKQQLQQKMQKPNMQQAKKPVVQQKPIIQQAKVVNKTPQGQRQVPQNKPFLNQGNRVDLKQMDPKIAEASRKAKIAMAVTKNAQILRKLHSVDLNVGQKPTKPKLQLKPNAATQQKLQGNRLKPALAENQIKNMQKEQLKKLQLNAKQNKLNVKQTQGAKKQVKPNVAQVKH